VPQFYLYVEGRKYPVEAREVSIGRSVGNHVVLSDPLVSGRHATVWIERAQPHIRDLGSTNGTRVNQQPVTQPMPLKPGDMIQVGNTVLIVGMAETLPGPRLSVWLPLAMAGSLALLIGVLAVWTREGAGTLGGTRPAATQTELADARRGLEPTPTLRSLLPTWTAEPTLASVPAVPPTPTPVPTYTSTPVPTFTPTAVPTFTPTPAASPSPVPSPTPTSTPTSVPTPAPDPLEWGRLATVLVVNEQAGEDYSHGSGGIVDPHGYVLTNYHVVEGADRLRVALNEPATDARLEHAYRAEVVASDAVEDLALLKLVADFTGQPVTDSLNLPSLVVGDSDQLKLGDSLMILSFQFQWSEEPSVTLTKGTVAGFVSDETGRERGWIQTDALISPGSSGGVAIDQAGTLVGVPAKVYVEKVTMGRMGLLRPINRARGLLRHIR